MVASHNDQTMNMVDAQSIAPTGLLSPETIRETLIKGLANKVTARNVLVLIPDHTRSVPLPFLFRTLVEILGDVRRLDFMVALGTHPFLDEASLLQLVGITPEERRSAFKHIGLLNHAWDDPLALATIGVMEAEEIKEIAGESWHPSMPERVQSRINRAALEYDHIIILGPTFPHEVAGFSGGAKYLFPGISGPEMINATHWLGALAGVVGTIGIKDTPVRAMIHAAAGMLVTPITLIGLVVVDHGLAGVFIGNLLDAWSAASDLSAERHIC